MKLKLTSIATLLVCAGAAQAQTSVTLYGTIDTGLFYQTTSASTLSPAAKNNGSIFAMKDAGYYTSYWGMKGSEDLGSGYKANFQLQGAYSSTTGKFGLSDTLGTTAIFNQIAAVGMSGPFGTFNAGRQITPMIYAMADTDVRDGKFFGSILTAWAAMNTAAGWAGATTNAPIGSLYDSNAIIYESPKFGGATLGLEYAPGGTAGSTKAATRESAVLRYVNGGLHLSAVYYNGYDSNPPLGVVSTPNGTNNNRLSYLGALYTINDFSVSTSFTNAKNPSQANKLDIDSYSLGLGYRFSPVFQITSGVYYLKDNNFSVNKSTMVALGAEYRLSKRTLLYLEAGHVNNKGDMTQMIAYGQPAAPGMATTAVMAGVRHYF
ncbi:porin [Glaciimonas soli]|uniref:Porin n=1 Tax=Glaciimonas soli TaxID=2590999 RepID=A0A843YRX3_9BURK|nr:porin [Glaciimonas soli]MQR00474.1 porin [Glaciimonas soli]